MKKEDLAKYLDLHAHEIFSIAQDVYDNPEISREEKASADKFKKLLAENGFAIHELEVDGLESFLPFIRYLPLEDYSGRYRNLQTQYYQGSWMKKFSKSLKTHEFEWVPDLLCFGSKRCFFCRKERIQERTNKN